VGAVVATIGRRPVIGAALALPYLRWVTARTSGRDVVRRSLRDAVGSVALLVGSGRSRRLLL
jgi:hypothetical protein